MTEVLTETTAPPEESSPGPTPSAPPAAGVAPVAKVEHTEGGWPAVPIAFSGTNTTAGLVATAALAGGPVAAVIAMTGAAVLGTVAARRKANTTKSKTAKAGSKAKQAASTARHASTPAGRGTAGGRIPAQPRSSGRAGTSGSRPGTGQTTGRHGAGQSRHRAGSPTVGRTGATSKTLPGTPAKGRGTVLGRVAKQADRLGGGRAGQVRALRAQSRDGKPSRAEARTATSQARRQVADARRATKAADRAARATNARGPAARTLAKGMSKAAAARDKAVGKARAAHDRGTAKAVASGRQGVRSAAHRARVAQLAAPAQKAARRALRRSALRFQARRAFAALLGGAMGALGFISTPLGRKLGWAWLMHPGRRLYRRLVGRAADERDTRDGQIRAELTDAEQAADAEATAELNEDEQQIGGRVQRPASTIPAPPTTQGAPTMSTASGTGFRFEELAAEMEAAAQQYEPEGCMEILAMIEGLPSAFASIAAVMGILAERSDEEFPLDKAVAETFRDCFGAVMAAASLAEEMGPVFRRVHEADIARHEDPRNGYEAEKGWNV
ncbi:hypothetical protein [Streptomyces avidinii]|uniref:Uncharacterized protein n=1 Tax=Streptomyces avidinii TaxID=1895 RepID=A0ABS4L9L2_STRAV|nr:hypothetical protein [Streptomyces avidinii]MBP2038800.1 hypothetical protein [Streptomyces avidinii]GGZ11682.1 hypothetical protein GCM10010343_42910 [Streptomyces avidinii]